MKTGIIAEFNPFHNGHKYLIDEVKPFSESITVAMSQDVVQRGEFASFDKWWRAETALENGADLVVGLPAIVSSQSAEFFAEMGVLTLAEAGVSTIACGSESLDLETIFELAQILIDEPLDYKVPLGIYLRDGYSYPKARMLALEQALDRDLSFLTGPNTILALEYAKAIVKHDLPIELLPIKRLGAGYESTSLNDEFASASGIRRAVAESKDLNSFLPYSTDELKSHYQKTDERALFSALMTKILNTSREELLETPGMNVDLLNRLYKVLKMSPNSYLELIDLLKTKNITHAAVRRLLINTLLDTKKTDIDNFYDSGRYLRVLGFNETGRSLLKDIKSPVITTVARKLKGLSSKERHYFDMDIKASNMRNLFTGEFIYNQDLTQKPIIKK